VQFIALDDFDDPAAARSGCPRGAWSTITCISEDAQNEWKQSTRRFVENERCTIAILDIGPMYGSAQQQTQRVYENVAFLALDLLSGIVAMRIDARPSHGVFRVKPIFISAFAFSWAFGSEA
jgi:hypothetical protein